MRKNPTKTVDEALQNFSGDWVDVNRKYLTGMEHLLSMKDVAVDNSTKTEVFREDKVRLFHYEPLVEQTCRVPLLISYALVNRYYMMDLQENRSLIQNLLAGGLDVYIIDWGYPTKMDAYLTMEDYIDGYLDGAVDFVREATGYDMRVTVLGHVQRGGTPTARDRVLATRFGTRAADMVAEGLFGRMAALHGDTVTDVPLQEAVGTLKTVPPTYYDLATPFFG